MLAGLVGASVQGRVALGPRAGARVRRLGHEPGTADVGSRGPRQAHLDGFEGRAPGPAARRRWGLSGGSGYPLYGAA